jgi:hypothetical protein
MVFANLFKTNIEAKDFAGALFQGWVIDVLKKTEYWEDCFEKWRNSPEFNESKCGYVLYVYQVSVVVLALVAAAEKKPEFDKVGPHFREHALQAVRKGLNVPEATFDQDVSEAVRNLTALIFTDPSKNFALSFEWTSKWIASFGANDNNPWELWKMGAMWKESFLHICRMLDEFKVI